MTSFLVIELESTQATRPGTVLGDTLRRYWVPAFRSGLLPEPDGEAKAVVLLGERLVAFRNTSGRVGLMDEFCPHRRASLAYGRVENDSIYCIYHAWRLDVDARVLECPGERNPALFAKRIKHKGYPTREQDGALSLYQLISPLFAELMSSQSMSIPSPGPVGACTKPWASILMGSASP